jgi:hypothetical protein
LRTILLIIVTIFIKYKQKLAASIFDLKNHTYAVEKINVDIIDTINRGLVA